MGWRSNATSEADDYQEAGDKAVAEGREDSAAMFYGLAADKRAEADRAEYGPAQPDKKSRRG